MRPARRRSGAVRFRRPLLLAAVLGGFLVLVGALSTTLAMLVSAHLTSAAIVTTAAHDRALIRLWADANLAPSDMREGGLPSSRVDDLEAHLVAMVERGQILSIEVRDPSGLVLFSNDAQRGAQAAMSESFTSAASGTPTAAMLDSTEPSEAVSLSAEGPLLREYLPIVQPNGDVAGVVGIWRDAVPILDRIADARWQVIVTMTVGSLVAAALLFAIFRAAQRRLIQQGKALVETTRRDPLTGLLNHGAVVAGLAERIELARGAGASVGIALIDVDNFRLLNDLHGHAAGDAVLVEVGSALGLVAPTGTLTGRYGPDEFLIIGPPMAAEMVLEVVQQLQSRLELATVQFGDSDQLPISVSGGLATFPDSASSVTDLLMAATAAAGEAKASGGGGIQKATARADAPLVAGGFSVLQGLVLAINTKDRYTKRHSEDVARYALFLGERLGLPAEELETLRVSGLLHDVGKVGIPDELLRKPGRLTVMRWRSSNGTWPSAT